MTYLRAALTLFLSASGASTASAQRPATRPSIDPAALALLLDSLVPRAMRAEHIPGAVVSVVSGGRTIFKRGYGLADLKTARKMSPDSTIIRIGSISKVMTAVAAAQLADRGRIRLDTDVNQYLRSVKVPDTWHSPITTHHLLTHTAALDEIRPGTQVERSQDLLPLAQFLRSRLVRFAPPGVGNAYSTYGMTLAGLLIEDVSGLGFEEYLRRNVWLPLGMRHTSIAVPRSDSRLVATPYDVDNDKPVVAPWEWYHTAPASSVNSTAADMARFMIAQLGGDTTVLSPRMRSEMQRRQTTMHPLLPGYGLGWQELQVNGERGVEHGGDVAGFSSLLTLLTDRGVGIFVAGHREGSDLRFTVSRGVIDRFFPGRTGPEPVVSMHASTRASSMAMARYAGHYRANIVCHSCARPRAVHETDIVANKEGSLTAYGTTWIEVSPRFFRSADGMRRFGFREDSAGRITHMTSGAWQVLERVPMHGTSLDSAGIREAVLDYVEGWYGGDAPRMERALHPELAKRILRADTGRLDHQSALTLVQGTKSGGGNTTPASARRSDVRIFEIYGNAATARATMSDWVDYMHLVRVNGRWKIANVLWEWGPAGMSELPGR